MPNFLLIAALWVVGALISKDPHFCIAMSQLAICTDGIIRAVRVRA